MAADGWGRGVLVEANDSFSNKRLDEVYIVGLNLSFEIIPLASWLVLLLVLLLLCLHRPP